MWDTASPHAHPTVHIVKGVIDKLSQTVIFILIIFSIIIIIIVIIIIINIIILLMIITIIFVIIIKLSCEMLDPQENPLDFVLDIHVSNTLLGFFVVGNAYDSVFRSTNAVTYTKKERMCE